MPSARTLFDYTLTSLLVASALAVAAVAVRREFFPPAANGAIREVAGWQPLARARLPAMGRADAPARVVLFSDFQCPYCRDLDGKLRDVLPRLRDRVAVVRYDLPLVRAHAHARGAAIASRCATRQHAGRRFDATLFEHDLDQPASDFVQLAGAADVPDLAAFRACMAEPAIGRAVDADVALAHRLGIEGVPALIVDGELYGGTMDTARLQALLSDAR